MTDDLHVAAEKDTGAASVAEPGQDCPTCHRRVPLPKTEKTPPTKRKGYWVPGDDYDDHAEVLEAAAKFLGTYNQPYFEFKTVTLGLYLILQDERLRGFATRSPIGEHFMGEAA